jgi:hypothetical protein
MVLRVFGVACLNITLSLYIMDYIQRGELVRSEPLRLTMAAGAWTLGPSLGVWLYSRYGAPAADGLSAAAALVLLATFWVLRLGDNPAIVAARRPPSSPLASIGRFLAQPRLRLAWLIAFGRSAWWGQFFTFAPLYMVTSGHGEMAAAAVISLGNAMLFLNLAVGRFATRFGVRLVIVGSFLLNRRLLARGSAGDPLAAAGRRLAARRHLRLQRARRGRQHPFPARGARS